MDTLSHGLWGSIAFGRKNRRDFWFAFITGVAPDLLSFGVFIGLSLLGFMEHPPFSSANGPIAYEIPDFVYALYNVTHSFVVFAMVASILYIALRRIPIWLFAWPLHILVDVFTHSREFFPTPFLWPISEYTFNGISWGSPYVFLPNVFLLAVLYAWFWYRKRQNVKRTEFIKRELES